MCASPSTPNPVSSACIDRLLSLRADVYPPGASDTPLSGRVLQVCLATLRFGERHPAGAHRRVEIVLDSVHLIGARARLRPEIARIGWMAPELEADQVVFLEAGRVAAATICVHLPDLQRRRVRGR